MTYTFYSDPGHAWLRVPLSEITAEMGISAYSYRDNKYAYLEEDCDAYKFIRTVCGNVSVSTWCTFHTKHVRHERTFIRELSSY
jgi:hypothetical protein